MRQIPGSFRDPAGAVFEDGDVIIRTVSGHYAEHWKQAEESGFFSKMCEQGKLIDFSEIPCSDGTWKTLQVRKIPFVSYPYEWCFHQLKDAALLTLELHKEALAHGMVMKDCSAYNIQFMGARPVFIDILSFEKYCEGQPWQAYRQFCTHFLAPLALQAYGVPLSAAFSQLSMDGVPLEAASALLPWKARVRPGLLLHLFAHARMQQKHSDARKAADKVAAVKMSAAKLVNLADSLIGVVETLRPAKEKTVWGGYYDDTNYSSRATESKKKIVTEYIRRKGGSIALDVGANTGEYTKLFKEKYPVAVASDIDSNAVSSHYKMLQRNEDSGILPLIINFANPTPAIGWENTERASFLDRSNFDCVSALAVVHHLRITEGIPLALQARFFASLLAREGRLVIEFVPKRDSQVQRMLAARADVFGDYTLDSFRDHFQHYFTVLDEQQVEDAERVLFLMQKND